MPVGAVVGRPGFAGSCVAGFDVGVDFGDEVLVDEPVVPFLVGAVVGASVVGVSAESGDVTVTTDPSSSTEVCTATLSPGESGTATPGFDGDSSPCRLAATNAPLTSTTTAAADAAIMRR